MKYRYWLKAFAPDPRGGDNYFLYDGDVDRSGPLANGDDFDHLMQALADHMRKQTGVPVAAGSIAIQEIREIECDRSDRPMRNPEGSRLSP